MNVPPPGAPPPQGPPFPPGPPGPPPGAPPAAGPPGYAPPGGGGYPPPAPPGYPAYPGHPGGPYPPPPPGFRYGAQAPVTEGKATTSLVLGLLSIFCFGILTGIPAIVVGLLARRDIARSGNALGGGGVAIGGIITGALGSLLTLFTVGSMFFGLFAARHAATGLGSPPPYVTPAPPPTATVGLRHVGSIEIAEAHVGAGPLREQLLDARSDAAKAGRTLVVEVRARWCSSVCGALDGALLDPRMQTALENVRLLRVDLDDFTSELASLSMLTQQVPTFYKIDSDAHVEGSVDADAWDDNTAPNMAPVLGAFARGIEGSPDAGLGAAPHGPAHHPAPGITVPSPHAPAPLHHGAPAAPAHGGLNL